MHSSMMQSQEICDRYIIGHAGLLFWHSNFEPWWSDRQDTFWSTITEKAKWLIFPLRMGSKSIDSGTVDNHFVSFPLIHCCTGSIHCRHVSLNYYLGKHIYACTSMLFNLNLEVYIIVSNYFTVILSREENYSIWQNYIITNYLLNIE